MRNIIQSILLLSVMVLASCGSQPSGALNVGGTITGADNLTIYIDKVGTDNTNESLLNTKADGGGKFQFSFPTALEAGNYRVRAGAKSVDLLLKGDEKNIQIESTLEGLSSFDYKITGSALSSEFGNVVKGYVDKSIKTDKLRKMAENEVDPLRFRRVFSIT